MLKKLQYLLSCAQLVVFIKMVFGINRFIIFLLKQLINFFYTLSYFNFFIIIYKCYY